MNTQITLLSDDALDDISGGEAISEAIGLMVSLAQAVAGAIRYEADYLQNAYYYSAFTKDTNPMNLRSKAK